MSVEIWENPNDPKPIKTKYSIGTADFEYTEGSFSKIVGDAIRSIYRGLRLPVNLLLGAIDGNGAACPTYGLWGGAGWNAGNRTPEGEKIEWETAPCYNNSIRGIENDSNLDTKTCYSLVDAICKTHDWRYDQAEKTYAKDSVEYKAAILNADKLLLEEIADALGSGSYSAPLDVPWTLSSFDGCTFDSEEKLYLTGLVPLFMAKIATVDIAGVVSAEAKTALKGILSSITINEATFEDSENSLKKTIYSVENGFLITREESASNINAWIIDLNSDAKPVNINIAYGADSTKADDLFVIGNGVIRINSGTGHNEITISGATNDTIANYTFEIADGGGNDTYYLDGNFNYKLIDSEANAIYVDDENGKWTKIGALRENTEENAWVSEDGSIVLTNNLITLASNNTIELNTDVQPGAFGINLINEPANPTSFNPIYLNTEDPDNTDHRDTWLDHLSTSADDKIVGGSGHDVIVNGGVVGGTDWLQGNAGNDFIQSFSNNNAILQGGSGVDALMGGGGSDQIFCDTSDFNGDGQIDTMAQMIARGETAASLSARGDLAQGDIGNDFIYGSDAQDGLFGNHGNDVIAGGGGDDIIYGDGDYFYIPDNARSTDYWNWSYSIQYDAENQTYMPQFSNINFLPGTYEGGADVIYGGSGNDYIDGGGGDDEMYGGTGNDTIFGGMGYDFIEGGSGDDVLIGDGEQDAAAGDGDYIDGGTGNDRIEGQGGDDNLFGGAGNDTLYGGAGDDYLDGEAGNDLLYGNNGADVIFGGADDDTIYGGEGDDYLDGEAGADSLYGGAGADVMFGGAGNDYMEGDQSDLAQGNDYMDGEDGDDTIIGAGGADIIYGGAGNDQLHGDAANVAEADQGDDYIDGEGGNNLIVGYGGNDTLLAAEGDDTIHGDEGNDFIDAGDGNNRIYGGDGDNVIFAGSGDDYIVAGIESGVSMNYVDAGGGNDSVWGGAGDNIIYGGAGNDQLAGGKGNDEINGEDGNDSLWGGEGNDTLYGEAGNDQLSGDAGDDYLDGGTGNDLLQGGAGNDTLIAVDGGDTFYFGLGYGADVIMNLSYNYRTNASYVQYLSGITASDLEYSAIGYDLQISIKGTADTLTIKNWFAGIEHKPNGFIFSDGSYLSAWYIDSVILGSTMHGTSGNDYLIGGAGYDTLSGGTGDDTLAGGVGDDTYIFNKGDGRKTIEDTATETEGNTLQFGEGISPDDLTLATGSLDIYIGTNGDVIHFNNFDPNDAYGTHAVDRYEFADGTVLTYKELIDRGFNITGTDGDDQISGTNAADYIEGLDGNDFIASGAGDDTLDGGLGSDTLSGGAGNDSLDGGRGDDTYLFGRGSGHDIIYDWDTTSGNTDTILLGEGISLSDINVYQYNNDLLITINGTEDTLLVSNWFYTPYGKSYYKVENIEFADGTQLNAAAIEQMAVINNSQGTYLDDNLLGTSNADSLYAFEGNDWIEGYEGNDTLDGGEGDDTIIGGAGADIMYGGAGNDWMEAADDADIDIMYGGAGDDVYSITTGDVIIENASEGIDEVWSYGSYTLPDNFENLYLASGSGDASATGNELDNYIGGNEGNNVLSGGDAGNDTLAGGSGDDTYIVDRDNISLLESGDIEGGYSGIDTVLSSITYVLGNNLENLTLTGTSAIDGIGNELNNILMGNSASNMLDGGSGNDSLSGDEGDDTYKFGTGSGVDEISNYADDYATATDKVLFGVGISTTDLKLLRLFDDLQIDINDGTDVLKIKDWFKGDAYRVDQFQFDDGTILSAAQLEGMGYTDTGIYGTSGDDYLTGTDLENQILGYEGNDTLLGYGGDDTLNGGSGDDYIDAGDGNDTIVESDGVNTIYAGAGDDSIWGGSGDDYIDAGDGNNQIIEYDGINTIYAGAGDDSISGGSGDDYINAGDGNNHVNDSYGNNIIYTGVGNDYVHTSDGADFISTGAGNDYIFSGAGNDTIAGGPGEDVIVGYIGDDTYIFNRGDGVKTIIDLTTETEGNILLLGEGITPDDLKLQLGTYGLDILIGNDGDIIHFKNSDYSYDFINPYGKHTVDSFVFADGTVLSYNELIDLSLPHDVGGFYIVGTSYSDRIGDGYYFGGTADQTSTFGNDSIYGGAGEDIIYGGAGDDYINGGDNSDDIYGGPGNDTLDSGADAASSTYLYSGDLLYGGAGDDTYIVDKRYDYVLEGENQGVDTVLSSVSYSLSYWSDYYGNILSSPYEYGTENLILTGTGAIDGTGNELNNVLTGNTGNNTLAGLDGSDTYNFGRGSGVDTIINCVSDINDYNDCRSDYLTAIDTLAFGEGITVADLELIKNNNDLRINVVGTDDSLIVKDWFFAEAFRIDQISFADGTMLTAAQLEAMGYQLLDITTQICGTANNDLINGTSLNNQIFGNAGNDTLYGNEGDDTLDGGFGNDILEGGAGNDTYLFGIGSGKDMIRDYASDYGTTFDKLEFGEGIAPIDLAIFQEGNNLRIELPGGEDSVLIKNWASRDGVSYAHYIGAEKLITPSQIDWFKFADGTELPSIRLEASLLGTESSERLQVWNLNDTQINGYGGDDTLVGADFDDTLDGGVGNDILQGGSGNDTYKFGIGSGVDTIHNWESYSGVSGNDIVEFGEGIAVHDLALAYDNVNLKINIKGTYDSLIIDGWFRSDYDYKVDQFKFADDTVLSADELTALGFSLYGSPGNDEISMGDLGGQAFGYAGDDTITGSFKSDIIDGGVGNDTICGKGGGDTYIFGIGSGKDTIWFGYHQWNSPQNLKDTISFEAGITTDNLVMEKQNYDLIINIEGTSDSLKIEDWFGGNDLLYQFKFADNTIMSAREIEAIGCYTGDNLFYGSDSDDTLEGNAGNDYLEGGQGNDTYKFGKGSGVDTIGNWAPDYALATDTVVFGAGVTANDLELIRDVHYYNEYNYSGTRSSSDLRINITGTSDSLIIKGYFDVYDFEQYSVDQFQFEDGTVLTAEQIYEMSYNNITITGRINSYEGSAGNDQIIGSDGDDWIDGGAGNDTLDGGAGNDTLRGGEGSAGNDIYKFNIGSGVDTIYEGGYDAASTTDTVEFGQGITLDNIELFIIGGDSYGTSSLQINIKGTTDSLIIENYIGGFAGDYSYYKIDQFKFADGTVLTSTQLEALGCQEYGSMDNDTLPGISGGDIIFGYAGNDTLRGYAGDDTLDGGAGNDYLYGGVGNDTYKFDIGSGVDRISNWSSDYASTTDIVEFGAGITISDLELVRDNGHDGSLRINIKDTSDSLLLDSWFSGDAYKVDQFKFADGTVLTAAQLESMGCKVYGSTFNDTNIMGSMGNDKLYGYTGDDTYKFSRGSGVDKIYNYAPDYATAVDTVLFGTNISTEDLKLMKYGDDLLIKINGNYDLSSIAINPITDQITMEDASFSFSVSNNKLDLLVITDWFKGDAYKIDQFKFANGSTLTTTQFEALGISPAGSDVDLADKLTYNATLADGSTLPSWLKFDSATMTFSGTPTNDNVGILLLKVTATDTTGASMSRDFNLTVVNVNDAPVIVSPIADQSTIKDTLFSYTVPANTFNDIDVGDILTYSATLADGTTLPSWLSFNAATQTLSGTPTNDNVGTLSLKVTATDMTGAYVSSNFNVTVENSSVNNPPSVANPIADQTILEDALFTFAVPGNTFVDIDMGDSLTYSAMLSDGSALPSWLAFDAARMTFSGTPGNDDVDTLSLKATATDTAGASVSDDFDVTIVNVNDAPVVANALADQYTLEDAMFSFTVPADTFADVDAGDTLTYSATLADGSVLPSWLAFNSDTITFSGTPTNDDVGTLSLKVIATDIAGASASDDFNITVENVNDVPVVAMPLVDQTTLEDELFTYTVPMSTFNDVDAGDILTYSATLADGSALPSWLSFDEATQTFGGTPTNDDVGTLSLKVLATDIAGASASTDFNITVENINDAPVVAAPLVDQTTLEDELYTFTVPAATFVDLDAGDSLTYNVTLSDGSTLPSWLTFNAATMTFSGTPGNDDVGTLSLKATATDTAGASVSDDFDVTIVNVNDAPVVANALADQYTLEDAMFSFTVPADTFADVDAGDTLTYSATLADGSVLPSWLAFNSDTMTFSGTPTNDDVGTLSLKVTATDASDSSVSDDFDVTIVNVNDAPVVANALADQNTLEDELYTFTVPADTFADIDAGDTLTYSATLADGSALPSWLTFNSDTMTFSGTPANDNVGTLSLKVTATDMAGASASDEFDLTVVNVNDAPVVANALADQNTLEDELYTFTVPADTFADIDAGDSMTYNATLADGSALPSWLTFDPVTQTFSGTPTNDDVGSLSLKVTATDASGESASDDFDLTVVNVNDAPFVVNPLADQTINKCTPFSYVVPADTFKDIDVGDILTYSATLSDGSVLPAWLTFDPDTMTFSGTPNVTGKLSIKVTATDGSIASVSDTFELDVRKFVYGSNWMDLIITSSDNDLIYAFGGLDSVYSGSGDDIIYGGSGSDFLYGEGGDDAIYGEDGNDYLYGGCGNDTLDGGEGADKMIGGAGNDTYVVDRLPSGFLNLIPGDEITEFYNEGIDTVQSSVTYALGSNVENLVLTGTSEINGTGNSLNNVLTGNCATNTLTGNAGNDTLAGGLGNDILTGGYGSDTYLFGNADGKDTLNETAGVSGDTDTLKLAEATTTQPVLVKQGNDLYVFIDENNYVRIVNEFQATNYGIERLEVSDGHYISRADIQTIVDTMSYINNDSGMDVMQKYNAMLNEEQYQNILAANWQ
jgi:Ca2+-binding RTX toxin-like protein